MVTLEDLLKIIREYNSEEEEIITKAYYFAEEHHAGKKRLSGEDYITHPLSVAIMAAKLKADKDMIIACLFHDLVEDCPEVTLELITELFGLTVAFLVAGVTRDPNFDKGNKLEEQRLNEAKMLPQILVDVRIFIIKVLDRSHNLSTIKALDKEKAKRKAKETLDTHVPMLNALGMNELKQCIEDPALNIYDPEMYKKLTETVNEITKQASKEIEIAKDLIVKELEAFPEIEFRLEVKTKSIYEIYEMLNAGYEINLLHDLLAIKVMVGNRENCYTVLGIINRLFPPLSHYSKDYIARPKENAYQALHTTSQLADGRLIQFRIKTFEMEEISREGITRYWRIWRGEAHDKMMEALFSKYEIFSRIKLLLANTTPNSEVDLELIHEEVYSKYIRVILPPDNTINVPKGATVIDLYFITYFSCYKEIEKIFVNEKEAPWDYVLSNDDCVYIVQKDTVASPEYLENLLPLTHTRTVKKLALTPK